jgi:6-carboxyhexanoate--CoA ligase
VADLWSVRMRASRGSRHISGAEGLFLEGAFPEAANRYARRALSHPRGRPDSVVITVERLRKRPRNVAALRLCTLKCASTREAGVLVRKLLQEAGVSAAATEAAARLLRSKDPLRGAALLSARTGARLDPDPQRGVRATRMGIEGKAMRALSRRLSKLGINNSTVKEALVLASKVASAPGVLAELCVSDDPDYTTGYVASRRFGYVRIPHIKKAGSQRGGRAFFVNEGAGIEKMVEFLETAPVIIDRLSSVTGTVGLEELVRTA